VTLDGKVVAIGRHVLALVDYPAEGAAVAVLGEPSSNPEQDPGGYAIAIGGVRVPLSLKARKSSVTPRMRAITPT
jgi:hypothetical protein